MFKRTYNFASFVVLIRTHPEFASSLVADMCRVMRFKQVITRRDPVGAWEAFTGNPVDIIFGDVAGEEGCKFLNDVRNTEISPNPHIPFIATAMTASPAIIARARDHGATEFLRFPLSASLLIERIAHVVEHPRMFVKAPAYAGPDRRRHRAEAPNGEERRKRAGDPIAAPAAEAPATDGGDDQWKIQA
jgi:two-component system, chemotaxis family, chemotaxis protein CheY